MNWREIPFVRLLLPFILGLSAGIYFEWLPNLFLTAMVLFALSVILIALRWSKIAFRQRWLYGITLGIFLTFLGFLLPNFHQELHRPNHFSLYASEGTIFTGTVQSIKPTAKKIRLELKIQAMNERAVTGKLLAYFDTTALARQLQYGDEVQFSAPISRIETAKNPKAFDFSRYMHFRNIHFQAFVKTEDWRLLQKAKGFNVMALASRLQTRFVNILRKHISKENEMTVAAALIIGYRDEIPEEIKTAYINTGAMHVLAVSGLHVGFIFLFIKLLLDLIKSDRRSWKIAKTIIALLAIWSFALVTGASASVLRAATMFSFIIIGQAIQRDANIYNTLAASAFFLLCINPYFVMDVGFQLSYLAVLGIVYFQPRIYKLLYVKNKVIDYIWKLTAVSIAAQITTLPISLYYFHQFPMYFWLSGLVVVPASVIVLGGGLLLFVVDGIPFVGWAVGKLLAALIWIINQSIFLIEQIPGSLIGGIWVSFAAVILLYCLIIALIIAFHTKKFKWLLVGLSALGLLGFMHALAESIAFQQEQLIVYHIPKHSAIDYISGKKLVSFTDEAVSAKQLQFATQNYRYAAKISEIESMHFGDAATKRERWFFQNNCLQLGKLTIVIIDQALAKADSSLFRADYLLLRNNPEGDLAALVAPFDCNQIIFDASNSFRNIKKWKTECAALGLQYHDVNTAGAFILPMQ